MDFNNRKERLNSPTSREVLKLLGLEESELYSRSMKEFLYMHPDVRGMEKEIQENRYKHFEEKRSEKIKMAVEKRQELISQISSPKSKENSTHFSIGSTAIKDEQKRFERIKNKQIWELQTMIDFEFAMEETKRKNEEKMKLQREKEEKLKQEKIQKSQELSKKRQMKEMLKEQKLKQEAQEEMKKLKIIEEEEQRKRQEETKRKELENRENRKRILEQQKKEEEFRKQIEQIFENQQKELDHKQKILLEKEEKRKKNLEEQRQSKLLRVINNSEKNKGRINQTLQNNEHKLQQQREVSSININYKLSTINYKLFFNIHKCKLHM
jgi:hypothetical protein